MIKIISFNSIKSIVIHCYIMILCIGTKKKKTKKKKKKKQKQKQKQLGRCFKFLSDKSSWKDNKHNLNSISILLVYLRYNLSSYVDHSQNRAKTNSN